MKPKTTIVLVILLVLVGVGVWLSKVVQRRAEDHVNPAAGKVFPNAANEAKKLTIERSDGTKLVFVHTNGLWNMIEPRLLPVRADAVESVVRMMTDLTYRRSFSSKDGVPAETVTGLDRPRWIIILADPSERAWTLQVGSAAPNVGGEDETYVRAGEQGPVYVVSRDLGSVLQRDVKDYRDMAAMPEVRRDDVVAVRVQGRQNYTLRKKNNQWDIAQPVAARAEPSAVQTLLAKLTTELKAQRFLAESAVSTDRFGLDRPQLVVAVTTRETPQGRATTQPAEKTYTLLLGNRRGRGVCAMIRGRPEVFTLPEAMLDELQPDLDSLRAKTLLAFSPADVDRVDVVRDGETTVLQRESGLWSMAQPFAGPTRADAADELLQRLAGLRADAWIATRVGESMDLPSPRATITLYTRDAGPRVLRVGSPSGDGRSIFCQPGDSSAIAVVNVKDVEKVLAPASRYWPRTLLPIPPDAEIQGMTIDRPDGSFVLAKCDDAWRLAVPVVGLADAKDMRTILDMLPGLEARKIITLGESLPEAYAKAKDRITVSLTTRRADGSLENWKLAVVKIGKDVYAWREGQPVVAIGACKSSLYTTLNAPLQKTK